MDAPAKPLPSGKTSEFPAIADYGVVGNLETVALIANTAVIEFFAYPHFDSPSLFAAILDREAGGAFALRTDIAPTGAQRYLEDTNVLVTRFEGERGTLEITDFMPMGDASRSNQLVRIIACVKGRTSVAAECRPRFDYARARARVTSEGERTALFEDPSRDWPVRLVSSAPIRIDGDLALVEAQLEEGERLVLNLVCNNAESDLLTRGEIDAALEGTVAGWREWVGQSSYEGRWRDAVMRSALALKLMFSRTHGSIVAAPTFGLPEAIGGGRNWDYRYCWIRDSAFTIYAMLRLGFTEEADRYRYWVRERLAQCDDGSLALMYRLDGGSDGLEERTLDHLSGYRGSTPVRIGNAAATQTQLDIYGEVIDSLYLAQKHLSGVSEEGWGALARVVDYVCENWREPGSGIWEMRGPQRRFLDAQLMCWVAVDRALRLAERTEHEAPDHWGATREAIRRAIDEDFWNEAIGAYVQFEGGEIVDASALLMPLMKFVATTDERFVRTMAAIEERLVEGPLVLRYERGAEEIEGFDEPPEGYFVTCSFWWIECLARSGRVEEACARFEEMLRLASPLGLFAEELGHDGAHLGNTPQALSHLSMISAAVALNRALDTGGDPF